MKALELTIYPTFWMSGTLWTTEVPGSSVGYPLDVDMVALAKRFTEAELLAEFHCARADYNDARRHPSRTYWTPLGVEEDATAEMALKRSTTMLHFATRPHYDEEANDAH